MPSPVVLSQLNSVSGRPGGKGERTGAGGSLKEISHPSFQTPPRSHQTPPPRFGAIWTDRSNARALVSVSENSQPTVEEPAGGVRPMGASRGEYDWTLPWICVCCWMLIRPREVVVVSGIPAVNNGARTPVCVCVYGQVMAHAAGSCCYIL